MKRKGVALIEVITVLAILLILASFDVGASKSILSSGNYNADKMLASTIASTVSRYKYETGIYPNNLSDLTKKFNQLGPWLTSSSLIDSRKQPLNYLYNENERFFKVWSNGANLINNSNTNDTNINGDDIGIAIRQ